MNLGNILDGVFGFLFPGWSDGDESSSWLSSGLSNAVKRFSGSGLTDADKEANAFSAEQARLAFERESQFQERMSNTQYQRGVQDMKSAGINPMMAVSNGGASVPSASSSAPSSVSPASGNLSGLLSSLISASIARKQLKLQEEFAKIQEEVANSEIGVNTASKVNIEAKTEREREETRGIRLKNDYFEKVKELRAEGERLANERSNAEVKQTYKAIDRAEQEIKESIARTKSEEEKQNLMITQQVLNMANAENIVKMRPFIQAEMSARTDSERASAQCATVQAAYQQGLIDEGMIKAAVRAENAGAYDKEVHALAEDFKRSIRDGSFADMSSGPQKVAARLFTAINGAVTSALGKW